ncbi:hypothetical protein FF1_035752 [Malus domestica]
MSEPCAVAWNAMIDGFGKNGEMGCAVLLFESMPERDVVSWKNVISSFGRNGCSKNVISCIGCMVWLLCNQEV